MTEDIAAKRHLWREQMERLGAASPEEKWRAAAIARERSLELLRAGVRHRNPQWSPEQVEDEVGLLIHGPETWRLFRDRDRGRRHPPGR